MRMPEPTTGYMEGPVHVLPVRVYYEDTDAGGVVYHANYLRFAERARSELLRVSGADNASLARDEGLGFVARRCTLDYIAPARLDDALEVRTRILETKGASFVAGHEIVRCGRVVVRIEIRIACVTGEGRPARMPRNLQHALGRLADDRVRHEHASKSGAIV